MAGHAAGHRVDAEAHVDALAAQRLRDLEDRVLRLGNRHTVTGDDHDLLRVRQQLGGFQRLDRLDLALVLAAFRGAAAAGTEAAGDDRQEPTIHRAAHDVAQDGARGTDQRAGHDQQVVFQHEAGRRRRPSRIAVEHRDHHGHVGTADGHHHVDAEQQREHGHDDQRHQAATGDGLHDKCVAIVDRTEQQKQVQPVSRREDQRVTADAARQLAERDDRARERHRTDEHADVGLDVVDRQLDARVMRQPSRIHEVGESDRDGGKSNQAVQYRDELGHLGHLHATRQNQAHGAANQQRHDELVVLRRYLTEYRRKQRDRHADDAVPVTAARRLLVGQSAQCEDEQDRRDDVRNVYDSFVDHDGLTS